MASGYVESYSNNFLAFFIMAYVGAACWTVMDPRDASMVLSADRS